MRTDGHIEGQDNWRIYLFPEDQRPEDDMIRLHDDFFQELDEEAVALAEAALVANPTAEVVAMSDGGRAVYLVAERRFDDGERDMWVREAPE